MGIRSHAFEQMRSCAACLVIRKYGSCGLIGAQKNGLRLLWAGPRRLARSAGAAGAGAARGRNLDYFLKPRAWRPPPPPGAAGDPPGRHSPAQTSHLTNLLL